MKNRIIPLLPLNWSELNFKEKKEYLLMIKKVLNVRSVRNRTQEAKNANQSG